jgi:hypothetical protein
MLFTFVYGGILRKLGAGPLVCAVHLDALFDSKKQWHWDLAVLLESGAACPAHKLLSTSR